MSIQSLREAFVHEGHGKITCTEARMVYVRQDGQEYQRLEFDGIKDGKPFTVKSDLIAHYSALQQEARKVARFLMGADQ